jgi:hypothetical protein
MQLEETFRIEADWADGPAFAAIHAVLDPRFADLGFGQGEYGPGRFNDGFIEVDHGNSQ